jgi:hypothetical protein
MLFDLHKASCGLKKFEPLLAIVMSLLKQEGLSSEKV